MKMKQVWSSPKTSFEQFVPQNYIAACGDTEKVYLFTCDAPGGPLYVPNPNKRGEYFYEGANYTPCRKEHETPVESDYYDGFVDSNGNGRQDSGEAIKAYIEFNWWGKPTNGHATANLDMNSWTVAKS